MLRPSCGGNSTEQSLIGSHHSGASFLREYQIKAVVDRMRECARKRDGAFGKRSQRQQFIEGKCEASGCVIMLRR